MPQGGAAANDWYVMPNDKVWRATGAEAILLKAAGAQGPLTYAQAEALAGAGGSTSDAVNKSAPNPLTGVAAIGDFFHRLTEKQTWVRVAEVGFGVILVYAGVRALAHGSTVAGSGARSSVTKPVKKTVKRVATVAAPEARLATRTVAKKAAPKTTARVSAHRERVAMYGAKKPYKPPPPRKPTVRVSHIYHHKGPAKP